MSKKKKKKKKSKKQDDGGVAVNLLSKQKLDELSSTEKIKYIINEIKQGKVLVLESGLTPMEQSTLIEKTMAKIDHDTFIGIEMEGYSDDDNGNSMLSGFIQKLMGVVKKPRMTVIGPAHLLHTVNKDNNMIETMIVTGKRSGK